MDERKSFRCKVFGPAAEAELELGPSRLACRLLDESAGGFAALVQCPEELTPGTVGRLRHQGGWFEVRIVHATRLKPAPETTANPQPPRDHTHASQPSDARTLAPGGLPAGRQKPGDLPADEQKASHLTADTRKTSGRQPDGQKAELAAEEPQTAAAVWRLGLERLGEVVPPAPSPTNWRVLASLIPLPRLLVRNIPIFVGGISIAVVVIAGPLLLVLHWPQQLRWISGSNHSAVPEKHASGPALFSEADPSSGPPPNRASTDPRLPIAELAAELARAASNRAHQPPAPAGKPKPSDQQEDIGKLIARLPGAAPFELPQVVERLGLTAQQRAQVRQIVSDCARTIEALEERMAGASRQQLALYRQAILEKARQEALQMLSPDQLAQWEQLSKASRPDTPLGPSAAGSATGRAENAQ